MVPFEEILLYRWFIELTITTLSKWNNTWQRLIIRKKILSTNLTTLNFSWLICSDPYTRRAYGHYSPVAHHHSAFGPARD